MGVPSTRTPVRIARGTYANLTTVNALAALEEGEICFATDLGRLYVKQGSIIEAVSATTNADPAPGDVTASPAFVSGTGTQSDPYIITNGGVPFSGGTLESSQEITLNATAGDIVVLTDNSASGSGTRFANQDVGIVNSAGKFTFKLKYSDSPGTTTNNTTYTGDLQIGTTYFSWVVVQSNFTQLSEATATTVSTSGLGVGDTATATEGTVTGGTSPYTYSTRWQRSFNGTDGWFNIGSTGTTYTFAGPDAGYYVRAVTTATDSTASNQGGPLTFDLASASTSQINTLGPATVGSLTLSEDNSSGPRYTSQSFSAVAVLNPEGVPKTTKNLKVTLSGTFSTFPSTSNITTITENDDIGTNLNSQTVQTTQNGGGTSSSSYYEWCAPIFYRGTGGSGFLNFPHNMSSTNSPQFWKTQEGIINNTPYHQDAVQSASNSSQLNAYSYYTDTTLTQSRNWYQDTAGNNSSSDIQTYCMYKPDCIIINKGSNLGGWQFIDSISTKSSETWRPILQHNNLANADYSDYFFAHVGTQYATFWSQTSTMHVATGDLTDYANDTTSTTQVSFDWSANGAMSIPSGYTSPYMVAQWNHGNKITFCMRFDVSGTYRYRLYTCDFSVNDGTSTSHWVFKKEITAPSGGIMQSSVAVNPNNTNQFTIGFDGNSFTSYSYYSGDGGETYTQFTVGFNNWSTVRVWGYTWSRNRLIAVCSGYTGGTGNSDRYWLYAQSANGGVSWTPAIYSSNNVSYYNSTIYSPYELLDSRGQKAAVANGGWIFGAGRFSYWSTSAWYYRSGFWAKDTTTLTFTDTTNLANNTIRSGDRIRQGSTTASVGVISSNTMTVNDISGTFSTSSPVTNTVSYFGGNISTLYAQINASGTVTDLTTSDPGFTNMGYLLDNTITFPATLPTGNAPDTELPGGTTIKVDAQFTNSQGTVSATSNTLTPS